MRIQNMNEAFFDAGNATDTVSGGGFALIPAEIFLMGSPESEPDRDDKDEIQHSVTISSFYMGKYPVTQKKWHEIIGTALRQRRDKANPEWILRGEGESGLSELPAGAFAVDGLSCVKKYTKK